MHVIGKDDPGVDVKGVAGAHPANRISQQIDAPDQQVRAAVEEVHREEEGSTGDPIAAIIRHGEIMPEL